MTVQHNPAIDIGARRELFVDEFLIDRLQGAALTLHPPTPREVVFVHDAPWEGNTCCYHTVFRDGDLFRMYYRGSHAPKMATATGIAAHAEVTCCVQSRDGIHWTRPNFGMVEFAGSKANNIVLDEAPATHNFSPFIDTRPEVPGAERYKALGGSMHMNPNPGLIAYASDDGVHWRRVAPDPVVRQGALDSQNLAFWSDLGACYVCYLRTFTAGVVTNTEWKPTGYRAISRTTSKDFVHWTGIESVQYDTPLDEQLYTNQITAYHRAPHIFLGFPKRFMEDRKLAGNQMGGLSDGVFMSSRDGLHFKRWAEAFIRPGLNRERWFNRNNMTAWGIVETATDIPGCPTELSLYSTEAYYESDAARLRRFTLRLDGFVSVQAPLCGGELRTQPLLFGAPAHANEQPLRLLINYSTSAAGSVRCEVQDAAGQPLPGFAMADADVIYGDEIERAVSWQGRTDVTALAGQPVRLRFELKDADLYALRFGAPQGE